MSNDRYRGSVAAEETWKREVAAAATIATHRRTFETAQAEHGRRRSMVSKIQRDIAEENPRAAERDRQGMVKERLVHRDGAASALRSPDSASKP